ncbi:MAG: helicase-related protein [Patescibacteria group bacterium]
MNKSLPIADYREQILQAIEVNSAVVITAETGAGKSTQVPQFLMEAGYRVVVTQPRRLAARTVAERVAEEVGCQLGEEVGFRTGFERKDSAQTKVLFCTDGLQLVRELTGNGATDVLVIDEVHEWNINIETLVAWTRKRLGEGVDFKVVLMSATLDAERLAAFFGETVPVISVPGRLFPVETKSGRTSELVPTVRGLVAEGRNVLIFQPGKREIEATVRELTGLNVEVLPLHGDMESADQRRAFRHYDRPKVVVATNVAQTSITIDDIDAVVDSGVERRVELVDGIEGLYLKPISQADCKQRAGRAGRCKEGIYVLCSDSSLESRPAYPKAEIERSRLDQLVLRLAVTGFDATALEFFHQPERAVLEDAKRALHALGAMSEDGQVTKIGRQMAKLPISVQYARMVIEAARLGEEEDVTTIVALLEAGGLRASKDDRWRKLTAEIQSDLLAELDLFEACQGFSGEDFRENGVFAKAYFRAKEIRAKLRQALVSAGISFDRSEKHDRQAIMKACVAGMVDHLYHTDGWSDYHNGSGGTRQKARESVVSGSPEWVVGLPKDIGFKDRRGYDRVLNLVAMVTAVDPMWLAEVAPQLVRLDTGLSPHFDSEKDLVVSTTQTFFKESKIGEEIIPDPAHAEAASVFANWLASQCL